MCEIVREMPCEPALLRGGNAREAMTGRRSRRVRQLRAEVAGWQVVAAFDARQMFHARHPARRFCSSPPRDQRRCLKALTRPHDTSPEISGRLAIAMHVKSERFVEAFGIGPSALDLRQDRDPHFASVCSLGLRGSPFMRRTHSRLRFSRIRRRGRTRTHINWRALGSQSRLTPDELKGWPENVAGGDHPLGIEAELGRHTPPADGLARQWRIPPIGNQSKQVGFELRNFVGRQHAGAALAAKPLDHPARGWVERMTFHGPRCNRARRCPGWLLRLGPQRVARGSSPPWPLPSEHQSVPLVASPPTRCGRSPRKRARALRTTSGQVHVSI